MLFKEGRDVRLLAGVVLVALFLIGAIWFWPSSPVKVQADESDLSKYKEELVTRSEMSLGEAGFLDAIHALKQAEGKLPEVILGQSNGFNYVTIIQSSWGDVKRAYMIIFSDSEPKVVKQTYDGETRETFFGWPKNGLRYTSFSLKFESGLWWTDGTGNGYNRVFGYKDSILFTTTEIKKVKAILFD